MRGASGRSGRCGQACVLSWLLLLTPLRALDVSSSAEEAPFTGESDGVRCYCNTADCVSTGYMCRAPPSSGGCYSVLPPQPRRHDGRYGCLHHLADTPEEAIRHCQNAPSKVVSSMKKMAPGVAIRTQHQDTLLLCCFQDLCNHEDSPLARRRLNLTHEAQVERDQPGYGSSEVWFKAATIAVPVCGAVILFLLVGVAVRLLRTDAADLKLRGHPYMSHPLAAHPAHSAHLDAEVKKVTDGCRASSPLLVAPGGCLVHVERAQLSKATIYPDCDIQR